MKRIVAAAILALAAVGCGSGGPSERMIGVRMHYSKYNPRTIEVAAGTTVEFVLTNTDPIGHEFVLGTHADQLKHEAGDPHDPHTGPGEALLQGSQTTRLRYTFDRPGTLEFACHRPGHYRYGMVGTIRVKG